MPDPMSAVEIEDVLSSIRRLVSEDLRPLSRAAPRERINSRLVLTPAHRVATAILTSVRMPAPTPAPPTVGPAETAGSAPMAQKFPQEILRTVDAAAGEAEADEESDVTRIGRAVFQSRTSAALVSDRADPVPPPAPEQMPSAPPPAPPDLVRTESEGLVEDVPQPALRLAPLRLEPSVAAPEASVEPARTAQDEERWIDQAEAEVIAALSADIEQDAISAATGPAEGEHSLFAEEPRFDEAVLRDLVRDLIREELQGSLGERITRNVRKLVRAEIARALSVRDLD